MRKPYSKFTGAGSNPVVCGRKFCSICGRWRPAVDFSCYRRDPLKLASRCRTCARADGLAMRRDPQRGELRREYDRIWKEGRRRAAGVPERQYGPLARVHQLPNEKHQGNAVPREPLAIEIRRWQSRDFDRTLQNLADISGVWEKRIREVVNERDGNVSVPIADTLCVAMGLHLSEVYPELYDLEFAA